MAAILAGEEAAVALGNALRLAAGESASLASSLTRREILLNAIRGVEGRFPAGTSARLYASDITRMFLQEGKVPLNPLNPSEVALGNTSEFASSNRATIGNRIVAYLENLRRPSVASDGFDVYVDKYDAEMKDAWGDLEMKVGSALEIAPSPSFIGNLCARAGITLEETRQATAIAVRNYGSNLVSRQVVSQWLVNRLAPVLGGTVGGAAAGFIIGQNPGEKNQADLGFWEKTAIGQWIGDASSVQQALIPEMVGDNGNFEELKAAAKARALDQRDYIISKILERELLQAGEAVTGGYGGLDSSQIPEDIRKALKGAATQIPYVGKVLGVVDKFIQKSAPTYPPVGDHFVRELPGARAFVPRFLGDTLSERPSIEAAGVKRTSIPPAPAEVRLSGRDSFYSPLTYADTKPRIVKQNLPPPPPRTTSSTRELEVLVPQNFDPTFTPALPPNVTGSSSAVWTEYSGNKRAAPNTLPSAPNVVGIGFDAEEQERKIAMEPPEKKMALETHTPDAGPSEKPTAMVEEPPSSSMVNAANATNPAMKDADKTAVKMPPPPPPPTTTTHLKP